MLTALILGLTLSSNLSTSSTYELTAVAQSELDQAASSLYSGLATQQIADAKSCKAPLAVLTIAKRPGAPNSTIRISSGSYTSPPFLISDAPQRVAVPFPAPYPVGKGTISVLGEGKDLTVWLSPGWTIPLLSGSASHGVYWHPKPNC